MKSPMSLRRYLLLQLGLVASLPVAVVALLMWFFLLPKMHADIGIHHQALARSVAGQISAHLMGGERQLVALAEFIQANDRQSLGQWDALLDTQCNEGELFETLYLVDQNRRIQSVGLTRSRRSRRQDLQRLDLSGRGLFPDSHGQHNTVWSETFLSTVSGRLAVAVAIPLKGRTLVGEIAVDRLSEYISHLPLESALLTIVLDRQGRIIAASQPDFSGRHLRTEGWRSAPKKLPDKIASHQFELDEEVFFGTDVAIAQLGWRVLVAQPLYNIQQPVRSTVILICVGLIIGLVLAVALGWLEADSLSKTYRQYAVLARSIAQGNYRLQWPTPRTQEFALLATNLKDMAQMIDRRERALEESQNNLRITLDSIGDAVIATDARGLISRMNPTAEQLTGWTADEAAGQTLPDVFRIVNAFTRATVANPVDRVLAEGQIVGLANHTVLIARDGQEYQIADSGAPIRTAEGEVVGVVLVFRDVTEAYAREQEIKENAAKLRNITANVPGVVFQFHATPTHDYSVGFVSSKTTEILGIDVPHAQFMKAFASGIPEEDRERYLASIRDAVDDASPWHYEGRFIKPSGQGIWLTGRATPQKVADGILFNGILVDITERRKMEEILRLTQFCFDRASIGIFRIGPDGQILMVNDEACRSLGYTREALCRMSIFDIDPDFSPEIWPDHMDKIRATGFRRIETRHRDKTGKIFPVEILINLMEFGREEFHIAFVQNISERKIAEQEAKRLENALLHAQKMEAIGTLAGGIAHDFNNILAAVIGYAELALGNPGLDRETARHLEQIRQAGMRARDLVRQILTFSRRGERELKPLLVEPLVKEALRLLRSSLPSTIEIVQQFAAEPKAVLADSAQVHQIIMNLCTNAAHAMEQEGGRLTIELSYLNLTELDLKLHPELTPGSYLKLSVQDTGFGIHPDILAKIFEPYFTTKEKGKGTGLGLAVVHGIVRSCGGAVYAYSEPESGSTFNVYIPTIEDQVQAVRVEGVEETSGREHILLVDDETNLLDVGRQMLARRGYQVSAYSDSCEALEAFRNAPQAFDLVLTDMTMPKLTGDKLAVAILQIRPDIPIILSTGYNANISGEQAAKLGIRAFLYKPVVEEELAATVRKALNTL
jgi:PAS domain S-box-containing protein